MSSIAGVVHAAEPAAAASPSTEACASFQEFVATDCPLTWHGITIYGAYDVGVGWVSHGLPENGYNYEGESLVNRNGNQLPISHCAEQPVADGSRHQGQDRVYGPLVRCVQRFDRHQSAVRPARQHGSHQHHQQRPPQVRYSLAGDGARAGQAFNDEFYGGISSTYFGTLTFGRQRALGTDTMLAYDPAGGAYSFSYIGYNGLWPAAATPRTPVGTRP